MPLVDQPGFNPDEYTTNGGTFNTLKYYLSNLPAIIGRWLGKGVSAYTETSTEFERDWNSPSNQMSLYADANVNPYEGFLSGSGGNGSPVSTASASPMAEMFQTMGNLISLGQAMADLRSKNLSNRDAAIDLARKQFEDKFYYGWTDQDEGVDENGKPFVEISRYLSKPERDYLEQSEGIKGKKNYNAVQGYDAWLRNFIREHYNPSALADDVVNKSHFDRLTSEYNAKRGALAYEWERFLKEDLGIDPKSSPWLTSLLGVLKNQSGNDSVFGRLMFGILQFLKGDY